MRHLVFPLTVFCMLISTVNCSEPKKSDKAQHVDLESIYEQNVQDSILATGWYYIVDGENGFKRQIDKQDEFYFIDPKPIVVKEHFDKLEIYKTNIQGSHCFALSIRIGEKYKDLWANATEKSIGKRLGLIVDNKLLSAPMVNMRIENGMSSLIRSDYDKKELEAFKKLME